MRRRIGVRFRLLRWFASKPAAKRVSGDRQLHIRKPALIGLSNYFRIGRNRANSNTASTLSNDNRQAARDKLLKPVEFDVIRLAASNECEDYDKISECASLMFAAYQLGIWLAYQKNVRVAGANPAKANTDGRSRNFECKGIRFSGLLAGVAEYGNASGRNAIYPLFTI